MGNITKAIIPVAGFATRLYPLSKGIKKSFMPIIDKDGFKPIILKILEDLISNGIKDIYLVIGEDEEKIYDNFFNKEISALIYNKLSDKYKEYEKDILKIGKSIHYVVQHEQKGLGHAVYLCKDYIKDEPVLISLGDTYFESENIHPIKQMLDFYDEVKTNIVACEVIKDEEIKNVGIMKGNWINKEKTKMNIEKYVEKPDINYAKKELSSDGKCFGNFGMWIINKDIFDKIESDIKNNNLYKNEIQLVNAIADLVNKIDVKALVIDGYSYDVGNFESYKNTLFETIKKYN